VRYLPLITLFWFFLSVLRGAENHGFEYARLDLLDGRTLKAVSVKSYDPSNDKLLILSDEKLLLIPAKLIPPPFAAHFRKNAKRSGGTTSTVPSSPSQSSSSRSQSRQAKDTTQNPSAPDRVDPEAKLKSAHIQAARSRADRFYRYEFTAGSNSISVTARNIEITRCEPITGWAGRYRSEGTARLEYYDSKGGSFQRVSSGFEVITETSKDSEITVVDFTRK